MERLGWQENNLPNGLYNFSMPSPPRGMQLTDKKFCFDATACAFIIALSVISPTCHSEQRNLDFRRT
jgi:hypothetical protein